MEATKVSADPMPDITWLHAADSDIGRARVQNEDAYYADGEQGTFVVADGMGGHAAGEIASDMAVKTAADRLAELTDSPSLDETRDLMRDAIDAANRAIVLDSASHPSRTGMGTTATVLVLRPAGRYVIGHVGDSRAYLLREGELHRVTEDHTYVQQLVNRGRLTDEQARLHPRSSLLTRALGTDDAVEIDVYDGEIRPGDRILLASDGLTGMIPEERLGEILAEEADPATLVKKLIAGANEAGGSDNITAVIVDIVDQ